MDYLFDHFPAAFLCAAFTIFCVVVVLAGTYLFNRAMNGELLKRHHDVTGTIFGTNSLIYSLILAFVIIAVWEDYEELNRLIEQEADKLQNIMIHAEELPDSSAIMIQKEVRKYAQSVAENEWRSDIAESGAKSTSMIHLRKLLLQIYAHSDGEKRVLDLIYEDVNKAGDYRRERLSNHHSHVPGFVWVILMAGTIITILFSYFFFVEASWLRYFLIALLTCMMAMCLFLVYMLDHPFAGSSRVSNRPFLEIYEPGAGWQN